MVTSTSIIETGVDKLVAIVKSRGRISLQDAAKELGVSIPVVEEWSDFLEEEGIISIEYQFTKPYLVERKLTKNEIETKVKEFNGKKDVFIRKAETSIEFLDKEAKRLKTVKDDFDALKKELGLEVDSVKAELKELEKYQSMKNDLDRKITQHREDSKKRIEEMHQEIDKEHKRYSSIVQEIAKEEEEIENEKKEAHTIEESEEAVKKKIDELKEVIKKLEDRLESDEEKVGFSEKHIERLKEMSADVKKSIEKDRQKMEEMLNTQAEQEKRMMELQMKTLDKIKEQSDKTNGVENASKKLKKFFDERMKIFEMMDRIEKERIEMEQELVGVIKKARSIGLSSTKDKDVSKNIAELEKKFKDVNKRKGIFEEELKNLSNFLRLG